MKDVRVSPRVSFLRIGRSCASRPPGLPKPPALPLPGVPKPPALPLPGVLAKPALPSLLVLSVGLAPCGMYIEVEVCSLRISCDSCDMIDRTGGIAAARLQPSGAPFAGVAFWCNRCAVSDIENGRVFQRGF